MRIAQAPRIVAVMHHLTTDPGAVATILAARGIALEFVHPRYGDALPAIGTFEAAVVFGGTMGVACGEAWMADELAWAAEGLEADVPMLGICLGAQILARALGARVEPHRSGVDERGYVDIRPTTAGRDLPRRVFQFHGEGFALPRGATLLAGGDDFPVQAFSRGRSRGLQFHPEVTREILEDWTSRANLDLARGCRHQRRRNEDDFARHQPAVARWLEGLVAETLLGGPAAARPTCAKGQIPMAGQRRGADPAGVGIHA